MKFISVYNKDNECISVIDNAEDITIKPVKSGYIELSQEFIENSKFVAVNRCNLYEEQNMSIQDGQPIVEVDGVKYELPKECYELYEGKKNEPITIEEVLKKESEVK